MAKQKILWLCSWYPSRQDPFNGDFIQRHARAAAIYHEIHVIHLVADKSGQLTQKEMEWQQSPGLTEQIIYYPGAKSLSGKLLARFRWLFLMKQAIRNYIIKNGRPALVHVHVPMIAGIAALWFRKRYKVPYVVTEHWGIYNEVADDRYRTRGKLFRYYTQKIFRKAAAFVSVSRFLAEGVNRLVVRIPYSVIPNATDTSCFFYRQNEQVPFRFIHVSNMVPLKNAEGIIRSFAAFLQEGFSAELLMVGDRDPAIRQYAAQAGIPVQAIRFTGEISYPEVAAALQRAHCLVLFSHIENSPCVIGEALCCGVPVIATSTGGIPELVDEQNSLLVPPADEIALKEAMKKMIQQYPQYNRREIAAAAAEKYGYDRIGQQFNTVYDQVLRGK